MARRLVKCRVTGEKGYNDEFYRDESGKYYKSEEIYLSYKYECNARKRVIAIIADFMGYQPGQPLPAIIKTELKNLSFYPNSTILHTIEKKYDSISWAVNNKEFKSDVAKGKYIFAIISNHIANVYRQERREQLSKELEQKQDNTFEVEALNDELNQSQDNKDLTGFLDE